MNLNSPDSLFEELDDKALIFWHIFLRQHPINQNCLLICIVGQFFLYQESFELSTEFLNDLAFVYCSGILLKFSFELLHNFVEFIFALFF